MTTIDLLRNKSDVGTSFYDFCSMVKTQYRKSILVWQTDNRMEFMDSTLGKYLTQNGIKHHACIHPNKMA